MKILLTGASSFTGLWFARELAAAGHHVVAPLRGGKESYSGVRAERAKQLAGTVEIVWQCPFGEEAFLALAESKGFEVLCHHAARVVDYRSLDFDVVAALAENTKALPQLLRILLASGLKGMVLTGSVFEADEGAGSLPRRSFSPYSVSKEMTAAQVRFWCAELSIPLGKFVIANPFGPYEEPRFCNYLVETWRARKAVTVRTPRYVRDNIHVSLLAKSYARFVSGTAGGPAFSRANPSGYVESQGAFALRFAREIGVRLGLDAKVELAEQSDFAEPMVRINTEPVDLRSFEWSETEAWNDLARYYREKLPV